MQSGEEGLAEWIKVKQMEGFLSEPKWIKDLEAATAGAVSRYSKKQVSIIQKAVDDGAQVSIRKDKDLGVYVVEVKEIGFKVTMLKGDVAHAFFCAVHGILRHNEALDA